MLNLHMVLVYDLNHPRDAQKERQGNTTQQKDKATLAQGRQLFFKLPRVGFKPTTVRLPGICSYQLSYQGSSAGWARITYTIQSNQSTSTKASHTR